MVKIRLIMADTDERYINRLSDYIVFHYANQFEISIFTDPEILEEYVQTNSAHCIVATRDFLKLHEGINSKAAFLLLHDGSELDEDYFYDEERQCLRGYRSRRKIRSGDRVRVRLDAADVAARELTFTALWPDDGKKRKKSADDGEN